MITSTTVPSLALEIVGTALSIDCVRQLLPAFRSRRWVRAEGRILRSQPFSGPVSIPWGRGSTLVWDPGVIYQYSVDGALYRSQRVSFRGQGFSASAALRVSRRYRVGAKVTVWHDPIRHDQAVLTRGPGPANFIQLAGGALLFVAGLAIKGAA